MCEIPISYIEQQIQYWRMMSERWHHPFYGMNLRTFERMKSESLDSRSARSASGPEKEKI